MYPAAKDYQNAVLIKLVDASNEYMINAFFTQDPTMYLKMYTFMQEHNIDIDINLDDNKESPYDDKIGTITDIFVSCGDKDTYPCIQIYVEVRDYR